MRQNQELVMSKPKMIATRITFSSAEQVPAVVKQFTERLDEVEPGTPPKMVSPGYSKKVYEEMLKGISLDDFLARMLATHDLVLAYYEAKTLQVRNFKRGGPEFVDKTYHNVPYFWMEKESARCHPRFAPRRPAILAEFMRLAEGHTLDLRRFDDNAQLTKEGERDGDWRRWEMSFN